MASPDTPDAAGAIDGTALPPAPAPNASSATQAPPEPTQKRLVPRAAPRKLIRTAASVVTHSGTALHGRTLDVGPGGTSLLLAHPMAANARCKVQFTVTLLHAKPVSLSVDASVAYCTLSGVDGFKVGLSFGRLDAASARVLEALVR